eukprot:365166-Chlamydomonas_euryale.AAC.5
MAFKSHLADKILTVQRDTSISTMILVSVLLPLVYHRVPMTQQWCPSQHTDNVQSSGNMIAYLPHASHKRRGQKLRARNKNMFSLHNILVYSTHTIAESRLRRPSTPVRFARDQRPHGPVAAPPSSAPQMPTCAGTRAWAEGQVAASTRPGERCTAALVPQLMHILTTMRFTRLGHMARMPDGSVDKQLLFAEGLVGLQDGQNLCIAALNTGILLPATLACNKQCRGVKTCQMFCECAIEVQDPKSSRQNKRKEMILGQLYLRLAAGPWPPAQCRTSVRQISVMHQWDASVCPVTHLCHSSAACVWQAAKGELGADGHAEPQPPEPQPPEPPEPQPPEPLSMLTVSPIPEAPLAACPLRPVTSQPPAARPAATLPCAVSTAELLFEPDGAGELALAAWRLVKSSLSARGVRGRPLYGETAADGAPSTPSSSSEMGSNSKKLDGSRSSCGGPGCACACVCASPPSKPSNAPAGGVHENTRMCASKSPGRPVTASRRASPGWLVTPPPCAVRLHSEVLPARCGAAAAQPWPSALVRTRRPAGVAALVTSGISAQAPPLWRRSAGSSADGGPCAGASGQGGSLASDARSPAAAPPSPLTPFDGHTWCSMRSPRTRMLCVERCIERAPAMAAPKWAQTPSAPASASASGFGPTRASSCSCSPKCAARPSLPWPLRRGGAPEPDERPASAAPTDASAKLDARPNTLLAVRATERASLLPPLAMLPPLPLAAPVVLQRLAPNPGRLVRRNTAPALVHPTPSGRPLPPLQ